MTSLEEFIKQIEIEISSFSLPQEPKNLYDPLRYFFQLGGKRLRPVLTLMTAESFGAKENNAMHASMAIELFHNFSLIHDDIMDEAPFPSDEKDLLNEFRNQFLRSDAQDVVRRMYQTLETPTGSSSSLFFVWPRLVLSPSGFSRLSCFLKRNYPEVNFRILFLTETEKEDEDGLLPFRYVQLKDDTITCKNWIDVLLKNKKNFI